MSKFWDLVSQCRWEEDHNYKRIRKFLMKTLNKEEIEEFSNCFNKAKEEIYKVLDAHDEYCQNTKKRGFGLSDNGFSDLCGEIIGRGKSFFNSVKANPEIAYKMAHKGEYHQSFIFSIPWEGDFERLTPEYYITRVQNQLDAFNEEKWSKYNSEINAAAKKYQSYLEETLASNNFESLYSLREEINSLTSFIKSESGWDDFGILNSAFRDYEEFYLQP